MAYEMKFTLNGKKYNVLNSSFSFNRSVDQKGRPSSGVYGGDLSLVLETQDDTQLAEIMLLKQTTPQKGDLEIFRGTNSGSFRKISFEDGFITSYNESASAHGGDNMQIAITISARTLSIGDAAKHVNTWPDEKA
jgi:hypothetical protein